MAGLWEQFVELHSLRGTEGEGIPCTITYLEIAAWASVTGRKPSVFDLWVLAKLEHAFWRIYHSGGKDDKPRSFVKQFALIQENKPMRKVAVGK